MTAAGSEIRLQCSTRSGRGSGRHREPVTVGLPFPKGRIRDTRLLSLRTEDDVVIPLQTQVLDRWSDGSVRWGLLDFQADCTDAGPSIVRLSDDRPADDRSNATTPVRVSVDAGQAVIETGAARFNLRGLGLVAVPASGGSERASANCRYRVIDARGRDLNIVPRAITTEPGAMRSAVVATGVIEIEAGRLEITSRYHFYAGLSIVRVAVTVRNPSRAHHRGGYWDLGDPGSRQIRDLSFLVTPSANGSIDSFCSPECGSPLRPCREPLLVYQDSSGGENWNSPNHRNRHGDVAVRLRGYQFTTGTEQLTGQRATPVVQVGTAATRVSIAHRLFWQRFPKAMSVDERTLRVGLLPQEFGDIHELQGGEQITEEFVLSIGDDGITPLPLDWVRDPLHVRAAPEWYCASEAMPHLTPSREDPSDAHLALVNAAIEGDDTFECKRERLDEYGWRNFGDLYADHEAVFHKGPDIFVSHYNNQYDAIAGFAVQYFRSSDPRWFTLLDDLARHVIDIDVYHTKEDKAAYNGGLFWHTAHHINADLATHRTYPRQGGASGGPAPEHNYGTGLMLYYFLTGDAQARDAVLSLAQWVIDMDDGDKTPFKWIARGPTGIASATGSLSYHGPGRAPGNSVVALLNAFRLTHENRYLAKADELIRRCSHPADDIERLNLLDAERRWFYTIFLQALARYLEMKEEENTLDEMYAYARAVLAHYASWMSTHEYPYLDKPEILEFPNETWVAQDMRKSEVFNYASKYAEGPQREMLLDRSRFFFDYSVSTLGGMPTRTFTRPLVLMLTNGNGQRAFQTSAPAVAEIQESWGNVGAPAGFTAQKTIAIRRLRIAALVSCLAMAAAMLAFVLSLR